MSTTNSNSTLSRHWSPFMIMYRPQELMTNVLLNFVGLGNQMQVEIFVELEQELFCLDTILVEV